MLLVVYMLTVHEDVEYINDGEARWQYSRSVEKKT